MATCLRAGACGAPMEAEADVRNGGEARAVKYVTDVETPAPQQPAPRMKNKLRSALQRSAAPGRVADVYKFGRTLGACPFHLGQLVGEARIVLARAQLPTWRPTQRLHSAWLLYTVRPAWLHRPGPKSWQRPSAKACPHKLNTRWC
jgi:hypothetical protein